MSNIKPKQDEQEEVTKSEEHQGMNLSTRADDESKTAKAEHIPGDIEPVDHGQPVYEETHPTPVRDWPQLDDTQPRSVPTSPATTTHSPLASISLLAPASSPLYHPQNGSTAPIPLSLFSSQLRVQNTHSDTSPKTESESKASTQTRAEEESAQFQSESQEQSSSETIVSSHHESSQDQKAGTPSNSSASQDQSQGSSGASQEDEEGSPRPSIRSLGKARSTTQELPSSSQSLGSDSSIASPGGLSNADRFPSRVLENIFHWLWIYCLTSGNVPMSLKGRHPNEQSERDAAFVWTIFAWRNIAIQLRVVSKKWKIIVDNSRCWTGATRAIIRDVDIFPGETPFGTAQRVLGSFCAACRINMLKVDPRSVCKPIYNASLGLIMCCEHHSIVYRANYDGLPWIAICSICGIDDLRTVVDRREHRYKILQQGGLDFNRDPETFPHAMYTCGDCRKEYFRRMAPDLLEPNTFQEMPTIEELQAAEAAAGYACGDIWSLREAAESAIEELWFDRHTSFSQAAANLIARKKHFIAKKKTRRLHRKSYKEESSEASDSEDDVADLTDQEIETLREHAMAQYCFERLSGGFWISPVEERTRKAEVSWECVARQFTGTGEQHDDDDSGSGDAQSEEERSQNKVLLSPSSLNDLLEETWKTSLEHFFARPFDRVVQFYEAQPKGSGGKTVWTLKVKDLLNALRKPQVWPRASEVDDTSPNVPEESEIGPSTMSLMRKLWKQRIEKAYRCECNICLRQKRKRTDSDVGSQARASSPDNAKDSEPEEEKEEDILSSDTIASGLGIDLSGLSPEVVRQLRLLVERKDSSDKPVQGDKPALLGGSKRRKM